MPFLLVHNTGLHSPSIHPNNNASSKRYETRHLEARATRKSSSSADHSRFRHSHQQTAPTQYLVHQHRRHAHLTVDKQNWLSYSLVDTRRRTAVESAMARNRSWRMMWTRGVGLLRLLSAPILMSRRCTLVRVWP